MKTKLSVILFFSCMILSMSCTEKKAPLYAHENKLVKYLNDKEITLKGNAILVVLQPECTCTAEHIAFTEQVVASSKYLNFLKLVIVPDTTHSIIRRLEKAHIKGVNVVVDENQGLRHAGVVMSVDRIFLFKDSNIIKLSDMHLTKYTDLQKEYL